jgi:hypothetical protein
MNGLRSPLPRRPPSVGADTCRTSPSRRGRRCRAGLQRRPNAAAADIASPHGVLPSTVPRLTRCGLRVRTILRRPHLSTSRHCSGPRRPSRSRAALTLPRARTVAVPNLKAPTDVDRPAKHSVRGPPEPPDTVRSRTPPARDSPGQLTRRTGFRFPCAALLANAGKPGQGVGSDDRPRSVGYAEVRRTSSAFRPSVPRSRLPRQPVE